MKKSVLFILSLTICVFAAYAVPVFRPFDSLGTSMAAIFSFPQTDEPTGPRKKGGASSKTAPTAPAGVVFSDDFSTYTSPNFVQSGAMGSSGWTVTRSGNDWGAKRSDTTQQLELTNDTSATGQSNGWVFASVSNTSFSSPYSSTLNANTGKVTWTFNMRQSRTDPGGFAAETDYGAAFILASNTTPNPGAGGVGYAVTLGRTGTTDPIRLIRFSNGLGITVMATSNTSGLTDFGTEYLSIRVTYDPSNNQWELFVRNDGTTEFSDPSSGTLTSQGTVTDSTYVSQSLSVTGAYWQGANLLAQAHFDNVTVEVDTPQVPGSLAWSSANQSASEANGAQFTVQRTGGSDGTVTIDYSLQDAGATGGSACTEGVDYLNAGGTIRFLNGETSREVNVQICDDSLYEGSESFNVILSDPTGGATLGSPSVTQYQIEDNDIPTVEFAASAYAKREGSTASVVITRTGATNATALVNYSLTTTATAGSCGSEGVDYAGNGGSVEFQIGETEKTIAIQLCTDSVVEDPNETILLTLDSAISAEIGSQSTTTLTILDGLQRSMWVFGGSLTPNPVSDPTGRSRLIGRSQFARIGELYVSVYQSTQNTSGRRMYEDADMASLNSLADAGGQEVWAAYGDTDWPELTAGCTGASFPELRMEEVAAFNASRPENEKFDGVMLDVEPDPQTEEEFQALIAHYECMRSRLPGDIKLGVAVSAFWDDDVINYPAAGLASKPVSSHIIDLPLDRVVVMGYRDNAGVSGGNGIIGLDEDEIAYADSVGKTGLVFAGLETLSIPAEDSVTFNEEGQIVMESEAAIVASYFDSSLSLGGFSIHNYGASYLSGDPGWPTGPTAAPVSISGRVMTSSGAGIRGAVITVQGMDGEVWSATTNTFGRYEIGGATAGASYVVTVSSRRYAFANGSQLLSLDDNVSGLDFIAER